MMNETAKTDKIKLFNDITEDLYCREKVNQMKRPVLISYGQSVRMKT